MGPTFEALGELLAALRIASLEIDRLPRIRHVRNTNVAYLQLLPVRGTTLRFP